MTEPPALVPYLLRLGDDRLVLGHRLSEWCGHAPILEEDIALANMALDLIGQATLFLKLAGEIEGAGRTEDALAYFRDAIDYRNALVAELPNDDFAFTIVRQFLFSMFALLQSEALERSANETIAGIAAKAVKELRYHVRHCAEWVVTLGRRLRREPSSRAASARRPVALHGRTVRRRCGGRGGGGRWHRCRSEHAARCVGRAGRANHCARDAD